MHVHIIAFFVKLQARYNIYACPQRVSRDPTRPLHQRPVFLSALECFSKEVHQTHRKRLYLARLDEDLFNGPSVLCARVGGRVGAACVRKGAGHLRADEEVCEELFEEGLGLWSEHCEIDGLMKGNCKREFRSIRIVLSETSIP